MTIKRIGLNAHLLSLSQSYRGAGISWYIINLLKNLADASPDFFRYSAFLSDRAFEEQASGLQLHFSRLPTQRPIVRIFWEQFIQPIVLHRVKIDLLHALRIDFKQLRYALEFFVPVLGLEAKLVIEEVKTMQDHLGDLNDAKVATQLLREFLTAGEDGRQGIVGYLQNREAEKERLLETFPVAWQRFNREETRRNLAHTVAAL